MTLNLYWDIETSGLNVFAPDFSMKTAVMLDDKDEVKATGTSTVEMVLYPERTMLAREGIGRRATLRDHQIIGHNIVGFDLLAIRKLYGRDTVQLDTSRFVDTLINQSLLDENNPKNLEDLGKRYNIKVEKVQLDFSGGRVSREEYLQRCINDCKLTRGIYQQQLPELKRQDLMPLMRETVRLGMILIDSTISGIRIRGLDKSKAALTGRLIEVEGKLRELIGNEINLDSPKQLADLFYETLGIPVERTTKKGAPSTDKRTLQHLRSAYSSVDALRGLCDLFLEYRKLTKLINGTISPLEKEHITVSLEDGRPYIHPVYNTWVTTTGRLSCKEPNIQQTPREPLIRRMYAAKGTRYKLAELDYAQLEMRLMAWQAGEESMLQVFRDDKDIHTLTLALLNNMDYDTVDSLVNVQRVKEWTEKRKLIKPINFNIIYLGSAKTMQESCWDMDIYLPLAEVQNLVDGWMRSFPNFNPYWVSVLDRATRDGYIKLPSGRTRRIDPRLIKYNVDKYSGQLTYTNHEARQIVNFPTQGTAFDIIRRAILNLDDLISMRRNRDMELLATIHDSVILQYDSTSVTNEEVHDILYHACVTQVIRDLDKMWGMRDVPLKADIHVGHRLWEQY